jgi:hypothetical protein
MKYLKWLQVQAKPVCTLLISFCMFSNLIAQNDDDVSTANYYAKRYKEDDVLCTSSYQYFTFDKGKNALGDKVVVAQEDSEHEFLALKKFGGLTYPEFYNKFVELNTFKKANKYGSKYITYERGGIDRSVTDDGIFFDDSRVQYYPIRFSQKGAMSRITVKKTYTDARYLPRMFFQRDYPTKEKVIEFKVPDWLSVEFLRMNFEGKKIEFQEKKKGGYTERSTCLQERKLPDWDGLFRSAYHCSNQII